MHFELKSISVQSIPEALAKVERYRLLNEPVLAESICLDILAIVPDHQQALISLLLARTDQFDSNPQPKGAREVLAQIQGEYEQAYYAGIIWERLGSTRVRQQDRPGRYFCISRSAGRNDLLRESRSPCTAGKRRCNPAMEYVCPVDYEESETFSRHLRTTNRHGCAMKPVQESPTLSADLVGESTASLSPKN